MGKESWQDGKTEKRKKREAKGKEIGAEGKRNLKATQASVRAVGGK